MKKFFREGFGEDLKIFWELKVFFFFNFFWCCRKMNDFGMVEEFVIKVLELKLKFYEVYYVRVRVKCSSR